MPIDSHKEHKKSFKGISESSLQMVQVNQENQPDAEILPIVNTSAPQSSFKSIIMIFYLTIAVLVSDIMFNVFALYCYNIE